jgi:hypothetical protein
MYSPKEPPTVVAGGRYVTEGRGDGGGGERGGRGYVGRRVRPPLGGGGRGGNLGRGGPHLGESGGRGGGGDGGGGGYFGGGGPLFGGGGAPLVGKGGGGGYIGKSYANEYTSRRTYGEPRLFGDSSDPVELRGFGYGYDLEMKSRPDIRDQTAGTGRSTNLIRSVDERLQDYFKDPQATFTDSTLQQISFLLLNNNQESWSQVPRLYTVLRSIDQLTLLDEFITYGITDIMFPFNATSLPVTLNPQIRARFLEHQSVVLTKALDLEKGEQRRHIHFERGEELPYEVRGVLGKGSCGTVEKVISLISHREFARKRFKRVRNFSKAQHEIQTFLNEVQILKRISHTHCVEMVSFSVCYLLVSF